MKFMNNVIKVTSVLIGEGYFRSVLFQSIFYPIKGLN